MDKKFILKMETHKERQISLCSLETLKLHRVVILLQFRNIWVNSNESNESCAKATHWDTVPHGTSQTPFNKPWGKYIRALLYSVQKQTTTLALLTPLTCCPMQDSELSLLQKPSLKQKGNPLYKQSHITHAKCACTFTEWGDNNLNVDYKQWQ